jgi:hypothetical protein
MDAPWGLLATIDLHECDAGRVGDAESIRRFVPAVIEAIGMRAHGPLMLERFDIFSCRPFEPEVAAAIAVAHFGGSPTVTVRER